MLGTILLAIFSGCYAISLGLEVSRLFVRSGVRGLVMVVFAVAGLATHTVYLVYRAGNGRGFLASEFDWCITAAWILAAFHMLLTWYRPRNPIGLFSLPLVLALIGAAQFAASEAPFQKVDETRHWGLAHGVCQLLGAVAALVGFITGVMYLLQSWRLSRKELPAQGFELPSLEWLQRANERSMILSVVFLLGGFAFGLALSWRTHAAIWWSDPVVWSSSLLAMWMMTAMTFNLAYKPARQGRKVAYLTVATFLFVVVSLTALLLDPRHGRPPAPSGAATPTRAWPARPGLPDLARHEAGGGSQAYDGAWGTWRPSAGALPRRGPTPGEPGGGRR
jgi:hypothetical protein